VFHIKISVATHEFGQDIRTVLHTAMQMRADGVQFDLRNQLPATQYGETARKQLLNYLRERDLQAASAHFALRSSLFEKERLEERLEAVRNAMVFASQLKIKVFTIRIGRLPKEDTPEYMNLILPIMSDLATHANHFGVTLCIIPAGDSAESLSALLNQIKTGPVAIDADLGSWVLSGRSPEKQLRELNQHISHIEIRDAVRDVDGVGEEVQMGRGEIDWDEIAALIGEMDYTGWLNVRRSTGNDKIGDSMRAIQYLRNLIPQE
jgi:sugar phosphate isomerase/epimerase